MNESEFWPALEYRICREFAGTQGGRDAGIWCDGLIPEEYLIALMEPKIIGRVWICKGSDQEEWKFVLFVVGEPRFADEITWKEHVPADDVTHWLTFDEKNKRIEINLAEIGKQEGAVSSGG